METIDAHKEERARCHGWDSKGRPVVYGNKNEGRRPSTHMISSPLANPCLLHDYGHPTVFLESAVLSTPNPINLPSIALNPGLNPSG